MFKLLKILVIVNIWLATNMNNGFSTTSISMTIYSVAENNNVVDMEETWKGISGYEGYYQVSNLGRIKSLKREDSNNQFGNENILKIESKRRYLHIALRVNGNCKYESIHRLVALAFIPNQENKPFVNHIDGNKHNNIYSNLEWVTAKENSIHAINNGLCLPQKKGLDNINSFKIQMLNKNGVYIKTFSSIMDAERNTGVRNGNISKVINNKAKTAGGYIWVKIV